MKRLKTIIFFVAIIAFIFSCGDDDRLEPNPEPEEVRSYSFQIKKSSSTIENATVSIKTSQYYYSEKTNNQGNCQIKIPNDVILPDFVIVTIDHSSIKPKGLSVPGSQNSSSNKTITCQSAPSTILVREATLHHLGNDYYSGAANSQHQLNTEGIQLSFSFYLSSIPSSMPYIQIYARGIEHPTEIIINGITTDKLGNTPANGDLGSFDGQLTADPYTVFQNGNNNLTIKTGAYNTQDPWDDIEFCALLLYYP